MFSFFENGFDIVVNIYMSQQFSMVQEKNGISLSDDDKMKTALIQIIEH